MFEHFFYSKMLAPEYFNWVWQGLLITIWISFCAIVASTLLGFVVAVARNSNTIFFRFLSISYISLFRNTPLLIQLFFCYFAAGTILPKSIMQWLNTPHQLAIFNIKLAWPSFEFLAGMIGLTLYSTPFIAEEFRVGINDVKQGQKFAAFALGLSKWQAMRYVILPQALKVIMSPLLGQYMNIIKNSSLTMGIGVAELSYIARKIESQSLQTFMSFGVVTIIYISIIALMEAWGQWRQQRLLIKKC